MLFPTDTAKYIFDDLYMIRVPVIATRTELDMELFGTVFTGNLNIDRGQMDEWITVMWSIERMVEASKKGVPIKIVNPNDSKKMYESITAHLTAWRDYKEQGINVNTIPYDDLVALDNFAELIYGHVKYDYLAKPPITSNLEKYFNERNFVNKLNLGGIIEPPKTKPGQKTWRDEKDEEQIPGREEFSKFFKDSYRS